MSEADVSSINQPDGRINQCSPSPLPVGIQTCVYTPPPPSISGRRPPRPRSSSLATFTSHVNIWLSKEQIRERLVPANVALQHVDTNAAEMVFTPQQQQQHVCLCVLVLWFSTKTETSCFSHRGQNVPLAGNTRGSLIRLKNTRCSAPPAPKQIPINPGAKAGTSSFPQNPL